MSEDKKTKTPKQEPKADPVKPEEEKTEQEAPEEAEEVKETKEEPQTQNEAPKEEDKPDPMAEMKDKYLRLAAEYDNFRKRTQREKESIYADVKADTLGKFLPVYDNLVRALNQSTEDEAYRKGVEMIMNQFNTTIEKLGVTKIDCMGKTFDPAFHNAIMHVDDETKGENEIVEVFQEGFMIGEKVIRFAMVKVAN